MSRIGNLLSENRRRANRGARWVAPFCMVMLCGPALRAQEVQSESERPTIQSPASSELKAAPLTLSKKSHLYLDQLSDPESLLIPAAVAGIEYMANRPREWGRGMPAYGKRMGSVWGEFQSQALVQFAVGAALHEDPRYVRSGLPPGRSQLMYVLRHTYMTRTDDGREMPAFSTFAGAIGGGFLPNAWLPPSQNGVGHALARVGVQLLINLGINMGHEFGRDDWDD